ncbi:ATP-binding protein [Streptomyces sp. NPDC001941]|uniref:ATP-binding protein n=1 Tax=Streptomyces sp. NPDC001941 TaxID=3154659 RepID=UPI003324CCD2
MSEGSRAWRVWGLICPGAPEEVARARRWTRDVLREHPRVDDAVLVVSELGTNALKHTASTSFRVTLALGETGLRVAVTDGGGCLSGPEVLKAPQESDHGRGLSIVSLLASVAGGGLEITGDATAGRTVTAEFPC